MRLVLLVRDPRAVMQSRKNHSWCYTPDCYDVKNVCDDMVSDFEEAIVLIKEFPETFRCVFSFRSNCLKKHKVSRVVRYEDLSNLPYNVTQELLDFYGLSFGKEVREFLDTHTKENSGTVHSTYRDSKTAPFHWIKELSYADIESIQKKCEKAMELWGYRKVDNSNDLQNNFYPLLKFSGL